MRGEILPLEKLRMLATRELPDQVSGECRVCVVECNNGTCTLEFVQLFVQVPDFIMDSFLHSGDILTGEEVRDGFSPYFV